MMLERGVGHVYPLMVLGNKRWAANTCAEDRWGCRMFPWYRASCFISYTVMKMRSSAFSRSFVPEHDPDPGFTCIAHTASDRKRLHTEQLLVWVSEAQVEWLHKNLLLLLLFIPALNENIRLCTTQEQSFRQQTVHSDLWPCSVFPGSRVRKEWVKPENSRTRVFVEPPDKWNINLTPVSHLWAFLYLFKNFPEKLISVFLKKEITLLMQKSPKLPQTLQSSHIKYKSPDVQGHAQVRGCSQVLPFLWQQVFRGGSWWSMTGADGYQHLWPPCWWSQQSRAGSPVPLVERASI